MDEFILDERGFVELHHLLKITGLCDSGGMAKAEIGAARVRVDGRVEVRKRCKIRDGQMVVYRGHEIRVSGPGRGLRNPGRP